MRQYLIDVETIPLSEEELLKLMPMAIANPVMPDEIRNPMSVDLTKCPVYSGNEEKQKAWRERAEVEWAAKTERAKTQWEEKAIEAKQRFIDDAALSATTGKVKLLGIRDYVARETIIFINEATDKELQLINKATYSCRVSFVDTTEKGILGSFSIALNEGYVMPGSIDHTSAFKLISFYGHYFDFPFLCRRCWMMGAPAPSSLRKGRYWNDSISTDLYDLWQLGDRQEKIGGMDGLARALGTKRKSGSGERFHKLWSEDPVAAILYLLDDLDVLEQAAEKMGAVYKPTEKIQKKPIPIGQPKDRGY